MANNTLSFAFPKQGKVSAEWQTDEDAIRDQFKTGGLPRQVACFSSNIKCTRFIRRVMKCKSQKNAWNLSKH